MNVVNMPGIFRQLLVASNGFSSVIRRHSLEALGECRRLLRSYPINQVLRVYDGLRLSSWRSRHRTTKLLQVRVLVKQLTYSRR